MSGPPLTTVVVLSWNRREDSLACLASLRRLEYPAYELVVVDNASTDGSAEAIRLAHPRLTLIGTGANLGFGGGINVGLDHARRAGARYALLLNNDTQVAADALQVLVDAAEADAQAAVLGPTIYYADNPTLVWAAGGEIDWRRGSTSLTGMGEIDAGQFGTEPRPVDFVTGCAILVRLSCLDVAGSIDPRFFAYYEEVEWCVRLARAGFRVVHVPTARIWHNISNEERAGSLAVHYYMTRNRLLFLRSTGAGWQAWAHTLVLEYLRTILSWSIRPRWRRQRAHRNVMLSAIRDYFTGRFGPAPVSRQYASQVEAPAPARALE